MTDYIVVNKVVDNDDGSASIEVDLKGDAAQTLISEGLELLLRCAAYKVDVQSVYEWIESQGIRPMTDEERQRAKEKSDANNTT